MSPIPQGRRVQLRSSADEVLQLSPTNLAIVLSVLGVLLLGGFLWWWAMTRRKRREVMVDFINIDGESSSEKVASGRWVPQGVPASQVASTPTLTTRSTPSVSMTSLAEVRTPPPAYTKFFVTNGGPASPSHLDLKHQAQVPPPIEAASSSSPLRPSHDKRRSRHSRFIASFHKSGPKTKLQSFLPELEPEFKAKPQSKVSSPPLACLRSGSNASAMLPRLMNVEKDFMPRQNDELAISAGHVVRLLEEYHDQWCLVQEVGGKDPVKGIVPRFCLTERQSITATLQKAAVSQHYRKWK